MRCDETACQGSIPCALCTLTKKLCRPCSLAYHSACSSHVNTNTTTTTPNNTNNTNNNNNGSHGNNNHICKNRSDNNDSNHGGHKISHANKVTIPKSGKRLTNDLRWLEWAKVAPSHWAGFEENKHLPWPRTHNHPQPSTRYRRSKGKTVVFGGWVAQQTVAIVQHAPSAAVPRVHARTKPKIGTTQRCNQPYLEMEGTEMPLEHCMPLLPTEGPGEDSQWDRDLEALRARLQQPRDLPAHEYTGDYNLREFPRFALRYSPEPTWKEPLAEDWTMVWRDEAEGFAELLQSFREQDAVRKATKEREIKRLTILHHHGPYPKLSRSNFTSRDYEMVYKWLDAHLLPPCVGLVLQYIQDNMPHMHWRDPPNEPPRFNFDLSSAVSKKVDFKFRAACWRTHDFLDIVSAWPVMRPDLIDREVVVRLPSARSAKRLPQDKPELPKFDFSLPTQPVGDSFLELECAWPVFRPNLLDCDDLKAPPRKPFPSMAVCRARMLHLAVLMEEQDLDQVIKPFSRRRLKRHHNLQECAEAFLKACEASERRFQECLRQPRGFVEPRTAPVPVVVPTYTSSCQPPPRHALPFLKGVVSRSCERRGMAAHERERALKHAEQFLSLARSWPQALRDCEAKWAPQAVPPLLLQGVLQEQGALHRQQLLRSAFCPFCRGGRHPEYFGRRNCRSLALPSAEPGSYDILP